MSFYAVRKGYKTGIYNNWSECELQVKGYSGAEYKKFKNKKDAEEYMLGNKEIVLEKKENIKLKDEKNLSDKEVVAYVDGSFDLASFSYSYGVVYFTKDNKVTYSGRDNDKDLANMRNVSGELKGAMVAMEKAYEEDMDILYLHYDYKGIEEWALGNWKANKDGTKKYKNFYDKIKMKLEVVFIKVPAHAGITYNEEADRLAKEAL